MVAPMIVWILAVVPYTEGQVWNEQRQLALVRFEILEPGTLQPSVGTGVMVQGLQGRIYVLTSTHVLTPGVPPEAVPAGCVQLFAGSKAREGSSGGAVLEIECVRHLGQDISLVELKPRLNPPYKVLPIAAPDIPVGTQLFLAGFPTGAGSPDTSRSGKVTSLRGLEPNLIVTNVLTAEGMSGGPYILDNGTIVGLHRGGVRYTAGFAQMTPISAVRLSLEYFLPRIPTELPTDKQQELKPKEKVAEWINLDTPFTRIHALAVSGKNLFAGSLGGGVFLSDDYGQSWKPINNGLTNLKILSLVLDSEYIFAGVGGYGTKGGSVFRSNDHGQSWVPSGLEGYSVYALAFMGNGVLCAGTYGSIFLSDDYGQSWKPINNGLTNSIVNSIVVKGERLFAGTQGGVFLSDNYGQSWKPINNGLTDTDIFILAIRGINIFAGTRSQGIFRSNNNGQSWTPISDGLVDKRIWSLTVHDKYLLAGTSEGGVYLLTDDTQSWVPVGRNLINPSIRALAMLDKYIFAGTYTGGVFALKLE